MTAHVNGKRFAVWMTLTMCLVWSVAVLAQDGETTPSPHAAVTPKILSQEDIALYQQIFAVQEPGDWKQADRLIAKLSDRTLMGHVLYQRYMHPTKYRSKFTELRDWMALYADHPKAQKIYRLAMRRKPAKARAPVEPVPSRYEKPKDDSVAPPRMSKKERARKRTEQKHRSAISKNVRKGKPEEAEKHLWAAEKSGVFTDVEFDSQMSRVGKAHYFKGNIQKALALGAKAEKRSGPEVPEASWFAGLAAWRMGRFEDAARHFAKVPESHDAGDWLSAAGAYWAARSHIKARQPDMVVPMLEAAAAYPMTFYGVLATRHLDQPHTYDWAPPHLTQAEFNEAMGHGEMKRAIALAEIGDKMRADEEVHLLIRRLPPGAEYEHMLKVAAHMDLTSSQITMARKARRGRGMFFQSALYPVPDWAPEDGFQLDRALLFAFMRQESNFTSWATSHAGARGLMQLMPATASYIHRDRSLRGSGKTRLYQPEFNIMLGQKYINYLMKKETTRGNLLLVISAYNAGPGNVAKWLRRTNHGDDWLLYMESIPVHETRNYVERVMANLWVYRARLGQPAPTLDQMAGGMWPRYDPVDIRTASAGPGAQ